MPADKPLVERALAALDEALLEEIKGRFSGLAGRLSGDDPKDARALADELLRFERGLALLDSAHAAARPVIEKIFKERGA